MGKRHWALMVNTPFASSRLSGDGGRTSAFSRGYIGTHLPPLHRSFSPTKSSDRGQPFAGSWGLRERSQSNYSASMSSSKMSVDRPITVKNQMLKHIDGELPGSPPMT